MASTQDGPPSRALPRLRGTWERLVRELAAFGTVGAVAFVVDTGTYNLLRFAGDGGEGLLSQEPLTAKVVSVAVATVVAWLGNRHWTFRHRQRPQALRELLLFAAMNAAGLLIALLCLGFTYYVLHLRTPLAENLSANVVGLVLGTAFRFWAYRRFVFVPAPVPRPASAPAPVPGSGPAPAPAVRHGGAVAAPRRSGGTAHVHDVTDRQGGPLGHPAG